MRTVISGGTVVTADGRLCERRARPRREGRGPRRRALPGISQTWAEDADLVVDATGKYVVPGGIDAHTHMEMPFGGTTSADTFETGTRAAAWGGTTMIIDFAIQTKGESLLAGMDTWQAKADGVCAVDYSFHAIISDVTEASLKEMDELVAQGVTSFKLFMAYPGVFYATDREILRAMDRATGNGALIMIHAENGIAIDAIVAAALARGQTDPIFHGLTRPAEMEGEAANRAIRLAQVTGAPALHRPPLLRARSRRGRRGPRPRPEHLRRDLPAVPVLVRGGHGTAGLRGRQVRVHAAASAPRAPGGALAGPAHRRPVGRGHRPLPVLLRGAKGAGRRATSRRSRTACPGVENRMDLIYQGVVSGEISPRALGRGDLDQPGQDVRPLPPKGSHRPGLGRRHRHLRPRRASRRSRRRRTTWPSTTRATRAWRSRGRWTPCSHAAAGSSATAPIRASRATAGSSPRQLSQALR